MAARTAGREPTTPTYRFLNTEGGWLGLSVEGVAVDDDGALTLEPVPGVDSSVAPCVPSTSEAIGPRGRRYVADRDGNRVRVLDPSSGQVVEDWQPFARPVALVASATDVFVVEADAQALTRVAEDGTIVASWWSAASAWTGPVTALGLQLVQVDGQTRLVVLAESGPPDSRLLVLDSDGGPDQVRMDAWNDLRERRRDPRSGAWQTRQHTALTGFVVDVERKRVLVVGDGALLCFDIAGHWVGRAELPLGWRARAVFVADGPCGTHRYVVAAASGDDALTLDPTSAWSREGAFVCGPVLTGVARSTWQELRARAAVPDGCSLRLWTAGSDDTTPPAVDSLPGAVAASSTWVELAGDPRGTLVDSEPSTYLWIGGLLTGDGSRSPTVEQVRVDIGTASWLPYLPPIYAEPGESADFLDRALRWLESELRDYEELLERLPARLDPRAVDDSDRGSGLTALDELASWLGVTLDEQWPETRRRAVVARAHRLHAGRGTAEGLGELLSLFVGAPVSVLDPPNAVALWVLDDPGPGEPGALGLTTRLAASAAQGAVVESTAIPGGSTLSDGSDYGSALFADDAHRFCVQAFAADLPDPVDQTALRRLVEAEKPAHLTYHLCLVDARARVGFQARVGVDAIVAGPPSDLVLDGSAELGAESALSGTFTTPTLDPRRQPRAGSAVLGHGLHLT